jgi:sugar/nucleoside kinase (ribokinase family)
MLDIISIGSVTADIFISAPFLERAANARTGMLPLGSKIEIKAPEVRIGGGAHNSAVTFACNGLKAGLLGKIGNDIFGKEIRQSLAGKRIKQFLIKDDSASTGASFILLDAKGERTILAHRGVSGAFTKKEALSVPEAKWAYINPGSMPLPVLSALVLFLHKRGTQIAINPSADMLRHGFAAIRPIFNRSRVVLLNREEGALLTRLPRKNKGGIFKKLDAEVRGVAILTDGKHGAHASDGKKILSIPALRVKKVTDMTGAGDAFGSAFVAEYMKSEDLKRSLQQGAKNAASVIQYMGATEGIK